MAIEQGGRQAWSFIGTGAVTKGMMLKITSVAGECDVATASTDVPAGIALQDLPADANRATTKGAAIAVGDEVGATYKAIASTTIAITNPVGPTTGGKAVALTLSATYALKWVWGWALTAGGTGTTDIIQIKYLPHIAGQ